MTSPGGHSRFTVWTRSHERLLEAWVDLDRCDPRRGQTVQSLAYWLGRKFGPRDNGRPSRSPIAVEALTVAQARQARRCLRAWAHADYGHLRLR